MTRDVGVAVRGAGELASFADAPEGESWGTAFETDRALLARVGVDGGAAGWRTHGERDAYGVVLGGRGRIEYGSDADDALDVAAGDFYRVPAGTAYRHVGADEEQLVCLAAFVGSGSPVVPVDPPASAPGAPPRAVGEDRLVPTGDLTNLVRLTPFPDAAVQQVRGRATTKMASDWHHHGDNDVFGHVLAGEGYVEWGDGEEERTLARAGEWFRVPAGVVHRDANPNDGEQSYVLWLTGSEPRLVRVDGPGDGRGEPSAEL